MKCSFGFSSITAAVMLAGVLGDILALDIRDTAIRCDYLIVAPQQFQAQAGLLAAHRNSFSGDDVSAAAVVTLENILSEFNDRDTVLPAHAVLWKGLRWVHEHWSGPPRYIVFVGDDRLLAQSGDSAFKSTGPMPTYLENNSIRCYRDAAAVHCDSNLEYSDTFYGAFPDSGQENTLLPTVSVGRIPCETARECSLYIEKVHAFDCHPVRGAWRDRSVLTADDMMQKGRIDNISNHYLGSEVLASGGLSSAFIDKIYLSLYHVDADTVHRAAKNAYFASVNRGALWSVYFGHGFGAGLADESFLTAGDAGLFNNSGMPTIMASFSCSNAAFTTPSDSSMCKRYLFAPNGGCIAYLACPIASYSSSNQTFARIFFETVRDSAGLSLGACLMRTHQAYFANRFYMLLGDPAIQPRYGAGSIGTSVARGAGGPLVVTCAPATAGLETGHFTLETYVLDTAAIDPFMQLSNLAGAYTRLTLLGSDSGSYIRTFSKELPTAAANSDSVKIVMYVWNDDHEASNSLCFNPAAVRAVRARPASARAQSLFLRAGNIVVNLPPNGSHADMRLRIVDTKGRSIFNCPVIPGQRCAVDAISLKLCGGSAYVAILDAGESSGQLRFILAK
jgi:hypothetical protein